MSHGSIDRKTNPRSEDKSILGYHLSTQINRRDDRLYANIISTTVNTSQDTLPAADCRMKTPMKSPEMDRHETRNSQPDIPQSELPAENPSYSEPGPSRHTSQQQLLHSSENNLAKSQKQQAQRATRQSHLKAQDGIAKPVATTTSTSFVKAGFQKAASMFTGSPRHDSRSSGPAKDLHRSTTQTSHAKDHTSGREHTDHSMTCDVPQQYQPMGQESIWQAHLIQEQDLRHQAEEHLENSARQNNALKRELHKKEQVINDLQDQVNKSMLIIRKQQEASFQQMASGRWKPSEDGKVINDLDRIKRDMKAWAKNTAVKYMAVVEALETPDMDLLMECLANVVVLDNGKLPEGLTKQKSSSIILNALLAHDIYTSFFCNPFFFIEGEPEHNSVNNSASNDLDTIYEMSQESNEEEAHIWRSQTLRLLLPDIRSGCSDGEKALHTWTKSKISAIASHRVSQFLASPARHLLVIPTDAKTNHISKLSSIYQEAALTSYNLWTRRTAMRCTTLRDMGSPAFVVDDPRMAPHSLIHLDENEEELQGRKIEVLVHPLLEVLGTDEAKEYDEARVWIPAEVWFTVENKR
ncbi:hypothetical protein BKA64DRAFT_638933 [Cadophora sp. MPI-SDFR-AT-0126]|nr:hypothetical protein BKA64DRAFT_638933 [Leotiomycetes sp. MPI-SDFR-AT-0126]